VAVGVTPGNGVSVVADVGDGVLAGVWLRSTVAVNSGVYVTAGSRVCLDGGTAVAVGMRVGVACGVTVGGTGLEISCMVQASHA